MEPERAEAVLLRLQPVTESSLILTWYSREFGKLRTMAKGARRPKSPFRGKLDLFYLDEILFLRSRRTDLHLLHDCFLVRSRQELRGALPRLTAASYACELVELATPAEDATVRVFELLNSVLDALAMHPPGTLLVWFELRLLTELGWRPHWSAATGSTKVLQHLMDTPLETALRVKLSAAQIEEMRGVLWGIWDGELGRPPKSRRLLAADFRTVI
jgi:DNA repair protein RecO (recombination protein O)